MSVDPAGFELINPNRKGFHLIESVNWYSYVLNNPVKYTDPTGSVAILVIGGIAAWKLAVGGIAIIGSIIVAANAEEIVDSVSRTQIRGSNRYYSEAVTDDQSPVIEGGASGTASGGLEPDPGDDDGEQSSGHVRQSNPSKSESKIWRKFENYRDGIRQSGRGRNRQYYEWDNSHNDIEVYDRNGNHLGSMDPSTGEMYKPPVDGRTLGL